MVDEYLMAALSPPMAMVEHDYERLELLGPCLLSLLKRQAPH